MNWVKKIFVAVLIVGILFTIGVFWFYSKLFISLSNPDFAIQKVEIPNTRTLYLKKYSRGLSYTIKWITLFPDENKGPNEDSDFIYESDSHIFYTVVRDTLVVYTDQIADAPKEIYKLPAIRQVLVDNPTQMSLYEKYRQMGLKIF
jgi:hypothetical protein